MAGKPTVEELGIDVAAQSWQRSGDENGNLEVAMVPDPAGAGGEWVLMRVTGDPSGRVLVYDRHEWECFLDGVRKGEFDETFDDGSGTGNGDQSLRLLLHPGHG